MKLNFSVIMIEPFKVKVIRDIEFYIFIINVPVRSFYSVPRDSKHQKKK